MLEGRQFDLGSFFDDLGLYLDRLFRLERCLLVLRCFRFSNTFVFGISSNLNHFLGLDYLLLLCLYLNHFLCHSAKRFRFLYADIFPEIRLPLASSLGRLLLRVLFQLLQLLLLQHL